MKFAMLLGELPAPPPGRVWIPCSMCGGAALVGDDGTACVCARLGQAPGWELATPRPAPVYVRVTFSKEVEVIVVGSSLEAVKRAAELVASSEEIERDWETGGWDVSVRAATEGPCHMGVVGDALLHIFDYNRDMGTDVPEAKD